MRAREIKPDYWPPYARWAAVLVKANKKVEAKRLIEEGLRYSPDAAPLREQYHNLGGDPEVLRAAARESRTTEPASAPDRASTSR